jgi:hypothetical protein
VIDLEYIRERVRGVGPLQLPSIRPICIMIYRKRQYTPRVPKPTVKLFVKPSVFDGDISLWAKGSLLQDVIAPFAARLSTEIPFWLYMFMDVFDRRDRIATTDKPGRC